MGRTQQIGQAAELLAEAYLRDQGLTPVARNVHFKTGELDLVMQDASGLVFVEVRSRNSNRFGGAAASITAAKQRRLINSALLYCQRNGIDLPWRIDVIAITRLPGQPEPEIHWIPSAVCS